MDILNTPLDQILDNIPFVPARYIRELKQTSNIYVVIHDMEAPETLTRAENTAAYFSTVTRPASTQLSVDADSAVRSVPDDRGCYGASGLNWNGVHIEHAGYARQSREEWLDDYSKAMLNISARITAAYCLRYNIPAVHVGVEGLKNGRPGIVTHWDSTIAFGVYGGHTDPGANFPMDYYIELVNRHLNGGTTTPEVKGVGNLITASVNRDNRVLEFKVSKSNKKVYHRWQNQPNTFFGGFVPFFGNLNRMTGPTNDPGVFDSVTSYENADGRISVAAYNYDYDVIFEAWQYDENGKTVWSDWTKVGPQ